MGEVLSLLFMMCRPESWEQLGVDGANVKIELTDRLIAEQAKTYRHNPSYRIHGSRELFGCSSETPVVLGLHVSNGPLSPGAVQRSWAVCCWLL